MMKKLWMMVLAMLMVWSVCCAEDVQVYVSLTNGAGEIVMAHEKIAVTDCDGDGVLSIHDALNCAHAAKYEGADGYLAEQTEYGMSLVRLWGEENGGSFGYYLNHASAWSLLDTVQDGDHVKAYAYTDLDTWADVYSFFVVDEMTIKAGQEAELTLNVAAFDASWNPVTLPAAGAVILCNDAEINSVTDENGKATIKIEEPGVYVISASSETQVLVAPVCVVTVE